MEPLLQNSWFSKSFSPCVGNALSNYDKDFPLIEFVVLCRELFRGNLYSKNLPEKLAKEGVEVKAR